METHSEAALCKTAWSSVKPKVFSLPAALLRACACPTFAARTLLQQGVQPWLQLQERKVSLAWRGAS